MMMEVKSYVDTQKYLSELWQYADEAGRKGKRKVYMQLVNDALLIENMQGKIIELEDKVNSLMSRAVCEEVKNAKENV